MQQGGVGRRGLEADRSGNVKRRFELLTQDELQALSSSYKWRIARHVASEGDLKSFLMCQRELSRRLP